MIGKSIKLDPGQQLTADFD